MGSRRGDDFTGAEGYPFDDDPPAYREKPAGDLRGAPWSATTAAARIRREGKCPPGGTAFKRRNRRRDLIILLCHEVGLTQRQIAEVFDLPRSCVGEIIHRLKKT